METQLPGWPAVSAGLNPDPRAPNLSLPHEDQPGVASSLSGARVDLVLAESFHSTAEQDQSLSREEHKQDLTGDTSQTQR